MARWVPHLRALRGAPPRYLANRRVWKCLGCKKQFSVKVGTIFEDSPLPLSKWLPAMWQLPNCKNCISSYELARALGVAQKTAWFMLARIRLAMQQKSFNKSGGHVELDETFIGGRARNMHKAKREKLGISQSNSMAGNIAVMGLLDRHGKGSQVRLKVVKIRWSIPVGCGVVVCGRARLADDSCCWQHRKRFTLKKVLDSSTSGTRLASPIAPRLPH
jgi:transposase-like protein